MLQELPNESSLREASRVVLETERLRLRTPSLADVKAIARIANDRRIAENIRRIPHPYTAQDAEKFLSSLHGPSAETAFVIETRAQDIIGLCSLEWRGGTLELGYWLGADHWGRGYATEAARAVIDFAFEERDVVRIVSGTRVANSASRRVLEKCGFQWTGVELHRFTALGSSTPVDRFRLDRHVWASLRAWRPMHRIA